uniref:Leucine-rich repeat-containing N-terminal plant-type domain-containing protein n=1 Tax=Kalanchoe fedtschenkoi TaxID=63787 RepID=A0A7N0TX32_KALFE
MHLALLSLLAFFSIISSRSSTEFDFNPGVGNCIEHERRALLQIKAAFTDPAGHLSSWTGQDCCSYWAGVTCSNRTGNVEELDLGWSYYSYTTVLTGDLSSSIADLKYLTHLNLAYIDFQYKTIPDFIGSMERLTYLDMSCSLFGGVIPPQFGNLRNLVELRLDYDICAAAYDILELNWLSGLFSLQYLEIRRVNLSLASEQWLRSVNMLANLKSLEIVCCELAYLPQTLPFLNLTSLTHLDLSNNEFNSLVPTWLSNASSLEDIYFSDSLLIGRIPSLAFKNMCSLQTIDLSLNLLEGGLAELIDALADCSNSNIQMLSLYYNQLDDYIPDSLGRLTSLQSVDLPFNKLFSSIPASIGNLAKLQTFMLTDNLMNGTIPESLWQLKELEDLWINDNQLHGVIRDVHLSRLVNLKHLGLSSSSKSLVFETSEDWSPPFNLMALHISDCQLGPSFPAWIATQTNLEYLFLKNTALSGKVPHSIWKLSVQLNYFDLSENQLQGNLPSMLMLRDRDGVINLENNLFNGTLPRLSNITYLSLKNNQLTGVMSTDLLGQLPDLEVLDLSGNMLYGNITRKWDAMEHLEYVDFSRNNLSGNVPRWRGDDLQEIRLHGNFFKGSLPTELCFLPFLHVLDLSQNHLSGPIPPCFGKMRGFTESGQLFRATNRISPLRIYGVKFYMFKMELRVKGNPLIYDTNLPLFNFIDLSGNELSGKIPEQITDLSYLRGLNLSGNHISGYIPETIGLLQKLESLDLSNNALDGHIPQSLASITSLDHLNLSHNNLSGPIPTKNQFQTFNDPSIYEGNPGLCGIPLSKVCNPHKPNKDHHSDDDRGVSDKIMHGVSEKMMLVISIVLGFIFGFWGVCGTLAVKKSWRDAYFGFLGI